MRTKRNKAQREYDVIVVGSGAAGGMSAYTLAIAGLKVLMLEDGRDYDPGTETSLFHLPKDAPLRGRRTQGEPVGFYGATAPGRRTRHPPRPPCRPGAGRRETFVRAR